MHMNDLDLSNLNACLCLLQKGRDIIQVSTMQISLLLAGTTSDFFLCLTSMCKYWVNNSSALTLTLGIMVEGQKIYLLGGSQATALQVLSAKVTSGSYLMLASLEVR